MNMYDFVEAVRGRGIVVIRLSEQVHALVNTECDGSEGVLFARYPESFYKHGYFEEPPEDLDRDIVKKAIKKIRYAVDELNEDNAYETSLGRLTTKEIRTALDEFSERAE